MNERVNAWPELVYQDLAPMVGYVNRLVQVAGKYTLDGPFEVGWGEIVLDVTPRGLRTPTLREPGLTFSVHYRLLDGDVIIESDRGSRTLPLTSGSVADFYESFCDTAAELGIPRPRSTAICEIPGAPPHFEDDRVDRTWDQQSAQKIWAGFNAASSGLEAWQASYLGHHPRVGVMWGGFDLSATRYCARPTAPPSEGPPFQRNGQLESYVSVGFFFGDAKTPNASMYAYIWPQPDGLTERSWGVDGAAWHPDLGLVLLPWATLTATADPQRTILAFGDAVYDAAVATAGWPSDLIGTRHDGWYMSKTPPSVGPVMQHG